MADGFGLRSKLDARIAAARRSLFWPALLQAALPTIIWFALFAAFWLFVLAATAFTTTPERRNPHTDARRPWWRRTPH